MTEYSRMLRALGQSLEKRRLRDFELEEDGSGFRIQGEELPPPEVAEQPPEVDQGLRGLLRKVLHQDVEAARPAPPPAPVNLALRFTYDDIHRLNDAGRALRGTGGQVDDSALSNLLRVIGAYVELKNVRLTGISKRNRNLTIQYVTPQGVRKTEEHTLSSFYDFSTRMYMRRGKPAG